MLVNLIDKISQIERRSALDSISKEKRGINTLREDKLLKITFLLRRSVRNMSDHQIEDIYCYVKEL